MSFFLLEIKGAGGKQLPIKKLERRIAYFEYEPDLRLEQQPLLAVSYNTGAVTYDEIKINIQTIADLQWKTVGAGLGVSYRLDFDVAKNVIFKVEEDSTFIAARFKKLILKRSNVMLWSIG